MKKYGQIIIILSFFTNCINTQRDGAGALMPAAKKKEINPDNARAGRKITDNIFIKAPYPFWRRHVS